MKTKESFPWPPERVREYVLANTRTVEVTGHYLSRIGIGLILALARSFSWEGADRAGAFFGRLMYLLRIRWSTARVNLDIVYGERKTMKEKRAIYRESLVMVCRHFANFLRVPLMDEEFLRTRFEIENEELLRDAYNRGKGVILVGGHIGEWDTAAGRIGMANYPIAIVAKKFKNPVMDKVIVDARCGMNLGTIAHVNSMQRIREGLARGEGVIMAMDQNMKRSQGMFVEWLGRTACTVRSNAWVARETGAPVICGYACRVAPGRFKLILTEEIPWEPCPDDRERELAINTRNQVKAIEKIILAHPELWFWIHRRWKTQPEGVPSPYGD